MKLELNHITKSFSGKKILRNFNLTIQSGEFVGIVGKSGSGKSTILNLLGLFDDYEQGQYLIDGKKVPRINTKAATKVIREKINYLFQNFVLVNDLTVGKNLELALKYTETSKKEAADKIALVLKQVGLANREKDIVATFSGGEQQRVAIARTMLKPGDLILADEPTTALDKENRDLVFALLMELNKKHKTIVLVTHDLELASKIPRTIQIS
ncbi:bacteriocin ABC transporter ATP-binding protein [Oenococcus oeni]|uniref:putative bacteriocin export ABC transporter n=1 Tax=Oenococcus oeni TaxID=1247 RepID=UPI0008F878AF|nr:putative bacteriocin export ABC transporter [Oenococcus oeni]OIK57777.1 bacteriocin ABC transporter ATP-binding protein [Oenococcus oeni]OIL36481.1 bacteriocin ABC transporter ATP-binding protein [Oenococcus oeni]OIM25399.1 bacteriocin ABC transporter ATP-binding protein [Oenococcus oeni]OIM26308.1 bacteriocin ABC transporter ATP-binding protein [Oenococcus oeni]OIM27410.1 bacteriocin ABC transporter ATP-binding protein [Oenococcus oeni]